MLDGIDPAVIAFEFAVLINELGLTGARDIDAPLDVFYSGIRKWLGV